VDESADVRAVAIVVIVLYDDAWLDGVTVGLRSMGLLSEPMEKVEEQGSTAPTKRSAGFIDLLFYGFSFTFSLD
jgi:hypothetical protein